MLLLQLLLLSFVLVVCGNCGLYDVNVVCVSGCCVCLVLLFVVVVVCLCCCCFGCCCGFGFVVVCGFLVLLLFACVGVVCW